MQNDAWSGSSTEGPIGRSDHDPGTAETASQSARGKPSHPSSETRFVLQNIEFREPAIFQNCISCETSLKKWKWKMWKRSFHAKKPYSKEIINSKG